MAKAKLQIESAELPKFKIAAELSDVQIEEGKEFGNIAVIEVKFRQAVQLFNLGRFMDKVSGAKAGTVQPEKSGK